MLRRVAAPLLLALLATAPGASLEELYWEAPAPFSPALGSFPVAAYTGQLAVIAWQEAESGAGGGHIRVSAAVKTPGNPWEIRRFIGGPYAYSGSEPAILSAAVDRQNRIFLAAAASSAQLELLVSDDGGRTFSVRHLDNQTDSAVAPRIFPMAGGGYLLFVTRGRDQSLSLYHARSENGLDWTPFEPFVKDRDLQLNFLPAHVSLNGAEYVVFQSFAGGADAFPAFQLFIKSSNDGGRSWTAAERITAFQDPFMYTAASADRFDNQRAHLSAQAGKLYVAWERRYHTNAPQIYGAAIAGDGTLTGPPERLNGESAYCNNPIAFSYKGELMAAWFDNRRGANRVYLARKDGAVWKNEEVSGSAGDAYFARPVISGQDLHILYQAASQRTNRIYALHPDTTVAPPRLSAGNFENGRRSRGDRARLTWRSPQDSSGIRGYSYSWSQDERAVPEQRVLSGPGDNGMECVAGEDGSWYFTIIAQDFAGNWSPPSRIEYIRDTTPPPAAGIIKPELDEQGFLPGNTFSLSWTPPPASDIAGYTWSLDYLGPASLFAAPHDGDFTAWVNARYPEASPASPRIMEAGTSVSFENQDNGVWRFSVSPVDEAGNIGRRSSLVFRINKYVPHTFITYVDALQDEQGSLSIRIIGRGFLEGGAVRRIILDRNGVAPYDREYFLDRGDYRILSDREIAGLKIDTIDEGRYQILLDHPLRGMYRTAVPQIGVDETGTVKFGDFSQAWEPSWNVRPQGPFVLNTPFLVMAAAGLFGLLGLAAAVRGIISVLAEGAAARMEAAALLTGDSMPQEKKRRIKRLKRRGLGLRFKLASFTIVLVIAVVLLVSTPLYIRMIQTQQETLLKGLWDRSSVLLEGLASGARTYLPSGNSLELSYLPLQSAAIPEARYVTITGYGAASNTVFGDLVWATNDPDIRQKIDTAEFQAGVSRLADAVSPRLEGMARELNDQARSEVGDLNASIAGLTQEALSLAQRTDPASRRRVEDIQVSLRTFESRLNERLTAFGKAIGSEPAFSTLQLPDDGNHTYIFFKPVIYRRGSEDVYFQGLIRLEISVDAIMEEITQSRRDLLMVISLVALFALIIGILGALVLSSLIIRPIRRLVSHVELIRDTEDKAKLEGVDIRVTSHDELAVLGSTINDMTHGLVKAAQAASDLTIGKEVQKKFIPLELDREGNKLTTGFKDAQNAQFFGYYEGAKGVSGDYFDYQDLDGRYYAIIKCDVAGKGIPAALIMIQVATMFLNYFKAWKPTPKGMRIEELVYQINDFIEAMGFKGRFAAFTLALFDSQTGLIRFCNAGDNIIHWYDASEGRMKALILPETPATGVLPNFMVESKGGYSVQTITIDPGDILFLYTDGIEEAKRKFRDSDFREIPCAEGGAPQDTPHANHMVGQGDEEMGPDRVEGIINAVMNRRVYSLYKYHNPEGDLELRFDFSSCEGLVEEAIMAMVSVEKMFRLYKDPAATGDNRVLVDKKADEFLKAHFAQYRNYCSETREYSENATYMYYTHVMEDPQYDDLTILGIKRK
jgi:hypothetical protein